MRGKKLIHVFLNDGPVHGTIEFNNAKDYTEGRGCVRLMAQNTPLCLGYFDSTEERNDLLAKALADAASYFNLMAAKK